MELQNLNNDSEYSYTNDIPLDNYKNEHYRRKRKGKCLINPQQHNLDVALFVCLALIVVFTKALCSKMT